MKKDTKLATLGRRKEWTGGVVNPPVYRASTHLFDSYADLRTAVRQPDAGLFYGRRGGPTVWSLQEAMRELEGGAGCLVYPSGMAAVSTAILAYVSPGDQVLAPDSGYETTRLFLDGFARRMGIQVTYYDPLIGGGIEQLLTPQSRVVLVESPGSLTFEVQDIPAIAEAAHARDAVVIMDNTWATPLLFDALAHGVDVSVQACTKYIVGHSDVMLGTATANEAAWPRLKRVTRRLGQIASPDDVYLALRGLRTLSVRLDRHEKNGLDVARWLADRPEVERLLHPAFDSCPGHALWQRDFSGASGLFSIVLNRGSYDAMGAFVDDMKLFKLGFSWGGYESLILPSDPGAIRTATRWKAPGPLVRLHVGLEDPADLIADLDAAFDRFNAAVGAAG